MIDECVVHGVVAELGPVDELASFRSWSLVEWLGNRRFSAVQRRMWIELFRATAALV